MVNSATTFEMSGISRRHNHTITEDSWKMADLVPIQKLILSHQSKCMLIKKIEEHKQTAQIHRLIWASATCIWLNDTFSHGTVQLQIYFAVAQQCFACWVKISAANNLIFFSYFPKQIEFNISCKISPKGTDCMKCQIPIFLPEK